MQNFKKLKKSEIITLSGEYITLKTAQKLTNLTASMLRKHIYKKDLKAYKISDSIYLISVQEALSFVPSPHGRPVSIKD